MAPIMRFKMRWSGYAGAPGYSVFHFRDISGTPTQTDANNAEAKIETFIDAIKAYVPAIVKLDVMPDCEIIEETNGQLINVFTVVPNAARAGTATAGASFAASAGMNITWRTGGIKNGRRVKGRSFLVPLSSTAFDTDGTPNATATAALNTAAGTLRANTTWPRLGVWARPSAVGATDGIFWETTGHSIPDKATILRSRRD